MIHVGFTGIMFLIGVGITVLKAELSFATLSGALQAQDDNRDVFPTCVGDDKKQLAVIN